MAFQSVPQTAEAVVRYTNNGVISSLTFYGLYPTAYDQTAIDDLAAAVDGWAGTDLRSILAQETAYTTTSVRGLENAVDFFSVNATGAGIGSTTGEQLPGLVAFAVKRITGLAGRSARGRVFLPVPQNDLGSDENQVAGARVTAYVAALNVLRADMLLAGWTEVVVSRYTLGAARPVGVTYPVTNYLATDTFIDTQRRRAPDK